MSHFDRALQPIEIAAQDPLFEVFLRMPMRTLAPDTIDLTPHLGQETADPGQIGPSRRPIVRRSAPRSDAARGPVCRIR